MRRVARAVVGLRPEEIPPLLFFVPSCWATATACLTLVEMGRSVPPRYVHGIWRLAITAALMAVFFWVVHRRPRWRHVGWVRDVAPFLFCISVYTNLHDTIHFVNPHDVHDALVAVDQWMFGLQPTVWAERFYTPFWTDYFSIAYANYFLIVVALTLWLLAEGRRAELREALFGTVLCFYFGYVLYVIFPAAPPRLVLAAEWTRPLVGSWVTVAQQRLVELSPTSSRGAFPSLHCAVTFITLVYAWRMKRVLFWILLVPAVSLVLATIYLRHHYVVDIYAGFALAVLVHWAAPRLAAGWGRLQAAYARVPEAGPAPAPGAIRAGARPPQLDAGGAGHRLASRSAAASHEE
jgi:membrane-associated phospholipid phosphatase